MNNMQPKEDSTTANYISIVVLSILAFSGSAYLIFSAIVSPPFDVELSIEIETKDVVKCIAKELTNRNIPYKITEHREKDWIVLRTIEDRNELQPILANECASFSP